MTECTLPHQDLIVLRRDPEHEALNGSELLESKAVHEIVHSGGGVEMTLDVSVSHKREGLKRIKDVNTHSRVRRLGFSVRDTTEGDIGVMALEEGYAELERGLFLREIGKPRGFADPGPPPSVFDIYKERMRDESTDEVDTTLSPAVGVALTLELLIGQDPHILTALRNRQKLEGREEFSQRVNALVPGLDQELRMLDYDADDALDQGVQLYIKTYEALKAQENH